MDEQARVLSDYRLEKAEQCLQSAEAILQIGEDYNLVVNRSYYAVFHCMRSILALEGKDFEKHSAVISYFSNLVICQQVFSKVFEANS